MPESMTPLIIQMCIRDRSRTVRWNEFRQCHDHSGQYTLCCVIEVRVLSTILLIAARIDNGVS